VHTPFITAFVRQVKTPIRRTIRKHGSSGYPAGPCCRRIPDTGIAPAGVLVFNKHRGGGPQTQPMARPLHGSARSALECGGSTPLFLFAKRPHRSARRMTYTRMCGVLPRNVQTPYTGWKLMPLALFPPNQRGSTAQYLTRKTAASSRRTPERSAPDEMHWNLRRVCEM